jgi:protocatechuate 3,4-dioxygenase beta subunit
MNNYIPDASERASLGSGFVITGRVRAVADCTPLEGVRVQVWLATETGGEQDNRASVRTGPDGRYRIETDPTIPSSHRRALDGAGTVVLLALMTLGLLDVPAAHLARARLRR